MTQPVSVDDRSAAAASAAEAFLTSTVYLARAGDDSPPGVFLSGEPGSPSMCVFTSLERLAAAVAARPGMSGAWLSMTGHDLATALPRGCGVLVDALSSPVFLSYSDIAQSLAARLAVGDE